MLCLGLTSCFVQIKRAEEVLYHLLDIFAAFGAHVRIPHGHEFNNEDLSLLHTERFKTISCDASLGSIERVNQERKYANGMNGNKPKT